MWDRFTELARKAVEEAQLEAGRLGENLISTEHLLLGLLRVPDCAALRILQALKIAPSRVRSAVQRHIARGSGRIDREMGFAPRGKRVLDLAGDEAKRLGHEYIGTSHLLLAIIREGEGLGGRALESLKVDLARARREAASVGDVAYDGAPTNTSEAQPAIDVQNQMDLRQKAEMQIYQARRIAADARGVIDDPIIAAVEAAVSQITDTLSNSASADFEQDLSDLNAALLSMSRAFYTARTTPHLVLAPSDADLAQEGHPDSQRWDRFTTRARKVVFAALVEAARRGDAIAGPEHLFLAVIRESDCVAAHVLQRCAIDAAALAAATELRLPAAKPTPGTAEDFTPTAKRILDLAFAAAREFQNNYIGTEHILLALDDAGGLPAELLNEFGEKPLMLRETLRNIQGGFHGTVPSHRSGDEGAEQSVASEMKAPSDSQSRRYTAILETANRLAAEHARPAVLPVHIAIAIFSLDTGIAARVIDRLDVDRSMVRKLLHQAEVGIGETAENSPVMSPEAAYVVDQACSIWKELLGCRRVGTEHLLVALFDDVKLSSLLVAAGLEPKAVVAAIRRLYDEEG